MSSERFELSEREGPRDECGVFGVYAPGREVARLSYFALYALQHRGQESAGIAVSEHGRLTALRDLGLAVEVLTPDFQGRAESIRRVVDAGPDVFAHNLETVRRLHRRVRDVRARYDQSLEVLRLAKAAGGPDNIACAVADIQDLHA